MGLTGQEIIGGNLVCFPKKFSVKISQNVHILTVHSKGAI